MKGALIADAVRLLLRGRPLGLLVVVGVLLGLFVRATRAAGSMHVHGSDLRGASVESWLSGLFLMVLVTSVVLALLLGAEDRESGFLVHVAVRPVRRVTYAAGRLLGLLAALAVVLGVLVAASGPFAGVAAEDLPDVRRRVAPAALWLNGEAMHDDVGQIGMGDVARFEFPAGARPEAMFDLRTKLIPGRPWSGTVELVVRYVPGLGGPLTWRPEPQRPTHPLPIHFDGVDGVPFALEVEVLSDACVLEVDRDAMVGIGPTVSLVGQAAAAAVLTLIAGAVAAAIAFLLSTGLSSGPAALAASFVLLVGLGRDTVLDIIANIGVDPGAVDPELSIGARWVRGFLTVLVRIIPDLSRLSPADRIGEGEAITAGYLANAGAGAALAILLSLLLTALCVQWKER